MDLLSLSTPRFRCVLDQIGDFIETFPTFDAIFSKAHSAQSSWLYPSEMIHSESIHGVQLPIYGRLPLHLHTAVAVQKDTYPVVVEHSRRLSASSTLYFPVSATASDKADDM